MADIYDVVDLEKLIDFPTVNSFASRGFMSVGLAAFMLADDWVTILEAAPNIDNSAEMVGKAFINSLNALIRECVEGNIQAYGHETGLPLEMHRNYSGSEIPNYDHNLLIRYDDFIEWAKKNGRQLAYTESASEEKPQDRAHVSDKLAILNQAAQRFWANADRNDRTTHHTNDEVVAWLIERGYSATLADKAATIIRPEWAATGRKPDK